MDQRSIYYLSYSQIIEINIAVSGNGGIVRDKGGLESALNRPQTACHYEQSDLIEQAALLIEGIARNHPFLDGNKRTALIAGITFLRANGYTIVSEETEVAQQIERLVIERTLFHLLAWMRAHVCLWSEKHEA